MKFVLQTLSMIILLTTTLAIDSSAMHYKGLPHYNYFANYPQTPPKEFLGKIGEYEISLVLYDFQGLTRKSVSQPDDARLYFIILNVRKKKVYSGPLKANVLDDGKVLYSLNFKQSQEENIYKIHRKLSQDGNYSLELTIPGDENLSTIIPFTLSSQKVNWELWVAIGLIGIIVVAGIGSRKVKLNRDRKKNLKPHNKTS